MGAEELWSEGDLDAAKGLYEDLLRSNWMDNIGARYNLLAIYDGMSLEQFNKRFVKDGYMDDKVSKWFSKGFKKHPLLVEWDKQVQQFM